MTAIPHPIFQNPHLEGDPFFWPAGSTGVLLVHGFTATTAEIRPLATVLFAQGYTVSGPVLPGHNSYPEDINKFTWRDWVAAYEQAYQDLAAYCDQIFIGGESTGGLLTLQIAPRHPGITGLLTYAPALKLLMSPLDKIKLRLAAPFVPYLPKPDSDDHLPWKGYLVNPLKGIIQLLALQKQVLPNLKDIHQPILIIQGKKDITVDASVPETIYNGVNSTVKEIHWMKNSGHCVAIDSEFDKVAEITQKFIEKVKT